MNRAGRAPQIDPQDFLKTVLASESWNVRNLPPDPNVNAFMMVGFPRSGTTLLENALSLHPDIATFEEKMGLDGIIRTLEIEALKVDAGATARALYYQHLRPQRPVRILIDKMPLHSAFAALFQKLFPGKRYVFSIRDPRDVVLSCFKQDFVPTNAMENFRTFGGSCALYDFVMTRWFGHFGLGDPRVCYVRYERLATDFAGEVKRVLDFVGADWSPAVLEFAAGAARRHASTPSYSKVRKGLAIGVQTAWQKYEFLFKGPEAEPIQKWIKFFGYDQRRV
jgi:hypothetical protein